MDDDQVATRARLKDLRRSLRERERTFEGAKDLAGEGVGRVAGLLAEARNTGILAADETPGTWVEAVAALRRAAGAPPGEQLARGEQSPGQAEFDRLGDEHKRLRLRGQREHAELDAMKALLSDETGFAGETREQVSRLSSLGLLGPIGEARCPLCDQVTTGKLPALDDMRVELHRASAQLERVARHAPGLEALIVTQEGKIAETKRLLEDNRRAREAVRRNDEALAAMDEAAIARAHTLGRISLFLESLPLVDDSSGLRAEIDELRRQIEKLLSQMSDEQTQERLESILSVISGSLTEWAKRLEHEYQGNPFRLDAKRLRLVADTDEGPIPMSAMGSAANSIGCHLMAHLALHSWFAKKSRPVPRFLFLDQPSQAYFPAERDVGGSMDVLPDEDRLAVVRMFELMRDVVEELSPDFQIIVTEHADIKEDWYQEAVVERWRNGAALIPGEWSAVPDAGPGQGGSDSES